MTDINFIEDFSPARFRPAAPAQLEHDPSVFSLMTGGAAKNPLIAIPRAAFELPYRRLRMLHLVYHGISDPDAIKRVFLDNTANYKRPGLVRRMLSPLSGDGLLNHEDDSW